MLRKSIHVSSTLFVERLEKDKDTDKDVDADRDRTARPVVDIDFRVSGLPHPVVKQAENFRVLELVKKIDSHPHRQDLQADLLEVMPTTHSVKNQRR